MSIRGPSHKPHVAPVHPHTAAPTSEAKGATGVAEAGAAAPVAKETRGAQAAARGELVHRGERAQAAVGAGLAGGALPPPPDMGAALGASGEARDERREQLKVAAGNILAPQAGPIVDAAKGTELSTRAGTVAEALASTDTQKAITEGLKKPGDKITITLDAKGGEGGIGAVNTSFEVSMTKDGKYEVKPALGLQGGGGGNLGKTSLEALVGVKGNPVFTFDKPEDAARAVKDLTTLSQPQNPLLAGGQTLVAAQDGKFLLDHLSAVEFQVSASGNGGLGLPVGTRSSGASTSATLEKTVTARLELAPPRTLTLESTSSLKGGSHLGAGAGVDDEAEVKVKRTLSVPLGEMSTADALQFATRASQELLKTTQVSTGENLVKTLGSDLPPGTRVEDKTTFSVTRKASVNVENGMTDPGSLNPLVKTHTRSTEISLTMDTDQVDKLPASLVENVANGNATQVVRELASGNTDGLPPGVINVKNTQRVSTGQSVSVPGASIGADGGLETSDEAEWVVGSP